MLDQIIEQYPDEEIFKVKGFDEAVIGISNPQLEPVLIYSVSKCLQILQQEMDEEDALEQFTYNICGGATKETTVIWCWDNY